MSKQVQTKKIASTKQPVVSGTPAWVNWFPFLIGILAFAIYSNTLQHGFVLDDVAVIYQNKFVTKGVQGIPSILTTYYWKGYWDSNGGLFRPLSLVMFALEWQMTPNSPFLHHLINVVMYALTGAMFYRFLKNLMQGINPWIPFLTVLLFILHPVHTEVVANIKSRDEIMAFLFFIVCANRVLQTGKNSILYKTGTAVLYLGALLSKESSLLYLPVLLLLPVMFRAQTWKNTAIRLLPLFFTAAIWLVWAQVVIRTSSDPVITYTYHDNSLVACKGANRYLTGITVLGRYMIKSVWPFPMSYDYSFRQIPCAGMSSLGVWLTLGVLGLMIFGAIKTWKKQPLISFGIIYFIITILLASNLVMLIGTTMGDRLLFAPVAGICITVVYAVFLLFKQTRSLSAPAIPLLLIAGTSILYAFKTWDRNTAWKSDFTLYTTDVKHAPNSARTHYNCGTAWMQTLNGNEQHDAPVLEKCISSFEESIRLDSLEVKAWANLGVVYYKNKNYEKSVAATRTAIALNHNDSTLFNNLADGYYKAGNTDSAIVYYNKVVKGKLANINTYNFLGVCWFTKANYTKAVEVFQEGINTYPPTSEIYMNLGNACGASKRYSDALAAFDKAYQMDPNNKNALYYMALVYRDMGNEAKSQEYLNKFNGKNP